MLLAIDDFQALYTLSMYRDPYFKMVKAYHLTLPRTLLEFASGKQSFVRSLSLISISCCEANASFRHEAQSSVHSPHKTRPSALRSS